MEIGDFVVLTSGSPKMAVSLIKRNQVRCTWYDKGIHHATINRELLKKIRERARNTLHGHNK